MTWKNWLEVAAITTSSLCLILCTSGVWAIFIHRGYTVDLVTACILTTCLLADLFFKSFCKVAMDEISREHQIGIEATKRTEGR